MIKFGTYSNEKIGGWIGIACGTAALAVGIRHQSVWAGGLTLLALIIALVVIVKVLVVLRIIAMDESGSSGRMGICRDCGSEVSRDAKACPKCGATEPALNDLDRKVKRVAAGSKRMLGGGTMLLILALVGAAITVPNEASLRSTVLDKIRVEGGDAKATAAGLFLTTEYKSFYVFSIAKAQFPTDSQPECYVGIFGKWFEVHPDQK